MSDLDQELSALGSMNDEDFMNQSFDEIVEPEVVEEESSDEDEQDVTEDEVETELDDEEEATDEEPESEDESEEVSEGDEPELDLDKDSTDAQSAFEKQILAPFKANGKMTQVANADEAVQLMQMGANYTKKMTKLKPSLKLIKMLENNNLLDEGKLNHLIDLSHKNKGAINKLLQDAEYDPMDMNDEDGTEYAPNTYTVSDEEMTMTDVLAQINETDTAAKTLDIVSNKWDDSSRQTLAQHPEDLLVINDHVNSGIYDQITEVVEKQRMLGHIPTGMSEYQAYGIVAEKMYPTQKTNQSAEPGNVPYTPTKTGQDNPKLKQRKKALASPKRAKSKKVNTVVDDSKLTDEEFMKQFD